MSLFPPSEILHPATLFEAKGQFGKYMFNVGAPEENMMRKVAELMRTATEKRLVLLSIIHGHRCFWGGEFSPKPDKSMLTPGQF